MAERAGPPQVWTGTTAQLRRRGWEPPVRALLAAAFGTGDDGFAETDWRNATGGWHAVLHQEQQVLAHASVVPRALAVGPAGGPIRRLRTGYVEAVATWPALQGRGHGTTLMRAAAEHIDQAYEWGALSTGHHGFYERLGWVRWRGRTFVAAPEGRRRTAEEDDGVMVLLTGATAGLDVTADLTCDWRPGDVW